MVHTIQEEGSLADIIDAAETGRETLEGWPLVTVETGAIGDSRSTTHERGPFFVGFWVWRAGTREFCSTLAALVGSIYFFPSPYIISIPLSPSLNKLGRQPCWVACLCAQLWSCSNVKGSG